MSAGGGLASPRLRRLASRAAAEPAPPAEAPGERCELCAEPLPEEHRHLLDVEARRLLCACRACSLLLDNRAAGGSHYRLVPDRRLMLDGFVLDDAGWAAFRIPVDVAFVVVSSAAGRAVAFYPGPMGATESLVELDAWEDVVRANPVLAGMEDDVEALLVNRACGAREAWLVPVDECYALVGLLRTRWRGLGGGEEVWRELDGFYDGLRRHARRVGIDGARIEGGTG